MAVKLVAANTPDLAPLNNLLKIVGVLRDIYPDMTLNQLVILLLVGANPGISQKQLMELSGLADSSASRIVAVLSEYGNRGTGPFHLIELRESKADRRYKDLHLTKRGQALQTKILKLMTANT